MAKNNSAKVAQNSLSQEAISVELRNKVARQIFEGARPTLERLAIVSNRVFEELKELAERQNWMPLEEAAVMRRRLGVLSSRVLALMEEPDEDALLSKTRLDAITSLLKAIDRLKTAIMDLNDEDAPNHDEASVTTAFAVIDQRIEDLAQAYAEKLVAEKLVESQFEAGAD